MRQGRGSAGKAKWSSFRLGKGRGDGVEKKVQKVKAMQETGGRDKSPQITKAEMPRQTTKKKNLRNEGGGEGKKGRFIRGDQGKGSFKSGIANALLKEE